MPKMYVWSRDCGDGSVTIQFYPSEKALHKAITVDYGYPLENVLNGEDTYRYGSVGTVQVPIDESGKVGYFSVNSEL